MATFDFRRLDKIVYVELPYTSITIQELYDECVEWLALPQNLDIENFIKGEGKASLGEGEYTGVTLSLIDDWRVQFADRGGPNWVNCYVAGGNLVAVNSGEGFLNDPIAPAAYVNVQIRQSQSPTLIETEGGGGGGEADWTVNEQKQIRQALGVDGDKVPTSSGNLDTLLTRITSGRAQNLDEITIDRMEQLDSGIAGSLPNELDIILNSRLTAVRASNLDNLDTTVSSRAVPGDAMTLTAGERNAIAGAILSYDMGSGRTVIQALASARNRWRIIGTGNPYTYEVYDTDDNTVLWSAQVTLTAGGEVSEINPN